MFSSKGNVGLGIFLAWASTMVVAIARSKGEGNSKMKVPIVGATIATMVVDAMMFPIVGRVLDSNESSLVNSNSKSEPSNGHRESRLEEL